MILFGMTERAAKQLRELLDRAGPAAEAGFRLTMAEGGEGLKPDGRREEDEDFTFKPLGISIFMDRRTAEANSGRELDYSKSDGQFRVVATADRMESTHWASPEPKVGLGGAS